VAVERQLVLDELAWQRELLADLQAAVDRGELHTLSPIARCKRRIDALASVLEKAGT
jgi:hypothetical protein